MRKLLVICDSYTEAKKWGEANYIPKANVNLAMRPEQLRGYQIKSEYVDLREFHSMMYYPVRVKHNNIDMLIRSRMFTNIADSKELDKYRVADNGNKR